MQPKSLSIKLLLLVIVVLNSNLIQAQTFAVIADKLVDPKNEKIHNNPIIIVHRNKIVDVRFGGPVPDSAVVINLKGFTLLPGLMDMHTHVFHSAKVYEDDLYQNSSAYRALRATRYLSIALLNGFTTIRDLGTEGAGYADIDLRRAVDSGFIIGPRIFASGRSIAATDSYKPRPRLQNWELSLPNGTQYVSGRDECIKAAREQANKLVDWIKLYSDWANYPTFNLDEITAVVEEAKKFDVPVAAHAKSKTGIRNSIIAGVRSIEHGEEFDDSLIQMAVKKGVFWSPTITWEEYYGRISPNKYTILKKAYQAKLKIVCGTDAGSFPWTINGAKELEYYVKKAGIPPMDAIKTATVNAAELLGKEKELGLIEKGFFADIIAVKGNPLEDITLLQQVAFVMKDGKIYKRPLSE